MKPAKIQAVLLHAFWLVLLAFSVIYYRERTYADTSYFLFKVINNGFFQVQHDRLVLAISQIGAVVGTMLGFNIKQLLLVNSVYNALFFYGVVAWIFHVIKHKSAAWLLSLFLVLHHWAYFSPYLEVFYSAAFVITFFAAFSNQTHFKRWIVLYYFLLWIGLMGHPIFFAVVAFQIVYLFIKDRKFSAEYKSLLLFFGIAICIRIFTFSVYETNRLGKGKSHEIDWYSVIQKLGSTFVSEYWQTILLLVLAVFILIKSRKLLLAAFVFSGYIFLLSFVMYNIKNGSYEWYYEVMMTPILLAILLPLMDEFNRLITIKTESILAFGLATLFAVNIYQISSMGTMLNQRYMQMQRLASEAKDLYPESSKFRFDDQNFEREFTHMGMQFPFEMMLASSEFGPQNTAVFAANQMMKYDSSLYLLEPDNFLVWGFAPYPMSEVDSTRFGLHKGEYKYVNSEEARLSTNEMIEKTSLQIVEPTPKVSAGEVVYPLVKIIADGFIFPSHLSNNFFLSYHILNEDGGVLNWDGERTPIETDIKNNFEQRVSITAPAQKGDYTIVIDILKEGEAWFEKSVSYAMEVN